MNCALCVENFEMDEPVLAFSGRITSQRSTPPARASNDWIAAPAFGEPPELVVIGGEIRLISPALGGCDGD